MVSVRTMRRAGIALLAAIGGMLLSPASPLAGEPPLPPQAVLVAPSKSVEAGKPVELDSSASTGQGQGAATASARSTATPALVPPKRLRHARHTAKPPTKTQRAATVRAASSAGVAIKNFTFTPGASTVHVGDTITWTNNDIA